VLELGLVWWPGGWICANGLRQGRDKIETKLVIDLLITKAKKWRLLKIYFMHLHSHFN
jgi:hypothetical protein